MAVSLVDTAGPMVWAFVPADLLDVPGLSDDGLAGIMRKLVEAGDVELVGDTDRELTLEEAVAIGQVYGDSMDDAGETNGMSAALRVLSDHVITTTDVRFAS